MAERGKIFKEAPIIAPNRSWFDLSYDNVLSMNMGDIVPSARMECLPGDIVHAKSSGMTRVAPLLSPVMSQINQFTYHFIVRMRDIWTNWDKFITNNDQKKTWQQQTSFVAPVMPYFKTRELIYRDYIADCAVQGASIVPNTNDKQIAVTARGKYNWLVVMIDSDSNKVEYNMVINVNDTFNIGCHYDTITGNKAILAFQFLNNLSDFAYDDDKTWYSLTSTQVSVHKINPFCNGSLMDYLGVDANPIYKSQKVITNIDSVLGSGYLDYVSNLNFFEYTQGITMADLQNIIPKAPYPFSIKTLRDFLETHAILQYVFIHGDGNTTPTYVYFDQANSQGSVVAQQTATISSLKFSNLTAPVIASNPSASELITEEPLSSLPLRAYRFIYDEYFRDQNWISVNPITDFSRDGYEFASVGATYADKRNLYNYLSCERKAWEHDPYTTALPGPQRGDAVRFLSNSDVILQGTGSLTLPSGSKRYATNLFSESNGSTAYTAVGTTTSDTVVDAKLSVDLSAATIENFRWANSMQKYLEKKARTGGRYYEYLLGIWNKSVDDSKLNRPIYLSGDRTPIQISEVLQTGATDINSGQPLGDMAGRGIGIGQDDYLEFEAPDYCFFFELTTIIPRVYYQSGLAPMFTRQNYLDYPLPDFAQLGEEYVKQSELYYQADSSKDNNAFGYQSRYYQWKYNRSEVHGEFKESLDFWTFARKFDSQPVNGKKFIEVDPDYRQFAVTHKGYAHFYCTMWHDINVNRALPEFGVPVL